MGPVHVYATLFEYGTREPGYRAVRAPRATRPPVADRLLPHRPAPRHPGQSGTEWFFTEAGRPFSFYAVVGSDLQRASARAPGQHALGLAHLESTGAAISSDRVAWN